MSQFNKKLVLQRVTCATTGDLVEDSLQRGNQNLHELGMQL